jgi:hypothetical protein
VFDDIDGAKAPRREVVGELGDIENQVLARNTAFQPFKPLLYPKE